MAGKTNIPSRNCDSNEIDIDALTRGLRATIERDDRLRRKEDNYIKIYSDDCAKNRSRISFPIIWFILHLWKYFNLLTIKIVSIRSRYDSDSETTRCASKSPYLHIMILFKHTQKKLDFKFVESSVSLHGKNDFAEVSKVLHRYRSENNFLGSSKLCTIERLWVDNSAVKSFNILAISLNVLYNYFNGSTKIIFRSISN